MSLIDISLEDTPQLDAVEEGEYEVQITRAEEGESNNNPGSHYLLLRLEIPSIAESKDMTHVMMLPNDGDTEKGSIKKKNRLIECLEAFGYDFSKGIDTEDLEGLTAWAYLGVEEDAEYGSQNRVKKWVAAK